jgi:hypothetical protein
VYVFDNPICATRENKLCIEKEREREREREEKRIPVLFCILFDHRLSNDLSEYEYVDIIPMDRKYTKTSDMNLTKIF